MCINKCGGSQSFHPGDFFSVTRRSRSDMSHLLIEWLSDVSPILLTEWGYLLETRLTWLWWVRILMNMGTVMTPPPLKVISRESPCVGIYAPPWIYDSPVSENHPMHNFLWNFFKTGTELETLAFWSLWLHLGEKFRCVQKISQLVFKRGEIRSLYMGDHRWKVKNPVTLSMRDPKSWKFFWESNNPEIVS